MRIRKTLIFILVLLFIATGCSGKQKSESEKSDAMTPSLTVVSFDEVLSILPCRASNKAELFIVNHLFDGLYMYDQSGQIVNNLAVSEKSNETNTVWTFELDQNAVWSDGFVVTADDFLYSVEFALSSSKISNEARDILLSIENVRAYWDGECSIEEIGVTVLSDTVFEIRFTSPVAHISSVMIHPVFFPMRRDKENLYSIADDPESLPCNGTYLITESDKDHYVFELNQKHINTFPPKTESILLSVKKTMSEVSFAEHQNYIVLLNEPFQFSSDEYSLVSTVGYGTTYLLFNYSTAEFITSDLRNVLQLSIRNQEISSQLNTPYFPAEGYLSTAFSSDNNVTSFRNGYSPCNITEGVYANNILVAQTILEETSAPYHSLTMIYNREDPLQKELALLLHDSWMKNLNLEVTPIGLNRFDYQDHIESNNYTLALKTSTLNIDMPHLMLEQFQSDSASNYGHFSSIRFDNCFQNCIGASAFQDYNSYCMQADTILYEDAAVIPLLYQTHFFIVSSSYSDYTLLPNGTVLIN